MRLVSRQAQGTVGISSLDCVNGGPPVFLVGGGGGEENRGATERGDIELRGPRLR